MVDKDHFFIYIISLGIAIVFLISCQNKGNHQDQRRHFFEKDTQWIYTLNVDGASVQNKELVKFVGGATDHKPARVTSKTLQIPSRMIQLEVEDKGAKKYIPFSSICFTKPISAYFFSFLFNRNASQKELDLLNDLIRHFQKTIECNNSADLYLQYQQSLTLQQRIEDLMSIETNENQSIVQAKMKDHLRGVLYVEDESIGTCLDIQFWQKLAQNTAQQDDDGFFDLLDEMYTDHMACSYTRYQIPTIQFDVICTKLGSFVHYNLIDQIEKQSNSVFENELKQLLDQLIQDITLTNHLWFSAEKAAIELERIIGADFTCIDPVQKIELSNRLDQLKNSSKYNIIDKQYEG